MSSVDFNSGCVPVQSGGRSRAFLAAYLLLAALSPSAFAQSNTDVASIRAQIEELRAEQARIANMQRQTDEKIRALAAGIGASNPSPQGAPGLGVRWPVRAVCDYVKNFGAETSADTGYGLDLGIGRAS